MYVYVYVIILLLFIIICVFLVRSASRSRILDGYTNIYFIYVHVLYPHLIHLIVVIMYTRRPQIVVVQGDIIYFSVRILVRIARQVSFCFSQFHKRTLNSYLLFIIYKFPLKYILWLWFRCVCVVHCNSHIVQSQWHNTLSYLIGTARIVTFLIMWWNVSLMP